MHVKLYRSSTVGIFFSNYKILCDPWLVDGEYYGSWSHFPKFDLKTNLDEINSYNAIYISHIHPDHCSEETLKLISKNIPIYIHRYHSKFLKFKLEKIGFKVFELDNNKRTSLGGKANINIIAADNCDPRLCYKLSGCADLSAKNESQQVDTLAIFDDTKDVLVNLNDCPIELAHSTFGKIKKEYDKISCILVGYGGAGPYPQCFENLSLNEKIIAGHQKKEQFLFQALRYIQNLNPKYFLPFAGTYTLSGSLSNLQNLRGVPTIDEAYKYLELKLDSKKNKSIKLNPDSIFDMETGLSSDQYTPFRLKDQETYIKNYLCDKKMTYEHDNVPKFDEIFSLAEMALKKWKDKKEINKVNLDTDIIIKAGDKNLKFSSDNKISILNQDQVDKNNNKFVLYKLDLKLLKKLFQGPKYAHWNNAEIGSHIKYYRSPNIYNRALHSSICYLHC